VAVAHTADDQAETVLHRLLRGTGLRGLAGMSRVRTLGPAVSVIRPLLEVRRGLLRDYLQSIGQGWSEDHSNLDERFTRNRLRRKLIPVVEQEFGANVIEAICRTALLAGEGQAIVAGETLFLLERAVVRRDRLAVSLACHLLRSASPVLVREALREIWRLQHWPEQAMGFAEWTDLATLATSEDVTSARMFPGGVRATRTERELELRRATP
jgi:tRNA(Ile)-lysidine synthase